MSVCKFDGGECVDCGSCDSGDKNGSFEEE